MRLSKIKLAGFKSFVDPTSIQFPTNLAGVVGPNGCGKSNVIDAVRWVMGESSAKNLRGDSMADVIFNGSSTRKPVGQASVELIFDNSDGAAGGQYAQYSEISIRRVVTRDGQSSYFLNGARCRRRDITDLFLGTGLGPRSYSIIEQGMISRVIEAKPEELRIYLEEAAGISKYKERRRETEMRMRHTRENLERLTDLRDEIGKQLAHLQRQAKTAERYKELKQEERVLRAQLQALRWRMLDQESGEQERQIRELEVALEARLAEQRALEADIERLREAHTEASDHFNEVQGRYYKVGADIARIEQAVQHAKDRQRQIRQDQEQVERAWRDAQHHQDSDERRIRELETALAEHEPALTQAQEVARVSATALAEAEQGVQDWQQQWEEFNRSAAEPSQAAQVERTRIEHLEQHLAQLAQRLARLDEERKHISTAELEREVETLVAQQAQQDQELAGLQQGLQDHQAGITAQREQNNRVSSQLDGARGRLQTVRGRFASLEALQQAALGKRQGAVSDWLRRQGLQDAQRLAQRIEVDAGWDRAVECVLGVNLQAVCVEGLDPVAAVLGELKHGAVALFDASVSAAVAPSADLLLAKLRSPLRLDGLLAGIYAADDLAQALALRARLQAHESVVTRDGIWLGRDWLRVARDADEKAGVLHREQELRDCKAQIAQLEGEVTELSAALDQGRQELRRAEEGRDALQAQLNQANRRHAELRAQLSGRQARLEQLRQRHERIQVELRDVQTQQHREQEEVGAARGRLQHALEEVARLNAQRERLMSERERLRESYQKARDQARSDQEAVHQLALRVQSTRGDLTSTRQSLTRMQSQLAQLGRRREELSTLLADAEGPMAGLQQELEGALAQRLEVEKALGEARRKVEAIDHEVRELGGRRNAAEQSVQDLRARLERARLGWQEIKVRRETLLEQVGQSGFELQTLLTDLPPEANDAEWDQRCEQVSQRIQRLGAINLAAIEEFQEQSERKTYLDAQHADLSEALETLENAIRKIDRETRTRFKETFDKVNSGIQALFPRLFGGGHAYLELTGEDLLDTGVTVMARPPGKRNSSIHLLSGGEKALTAVALVFSIFELNPAPFCLLDEVDAPLDEANVGRFCNMVREMSKQVQFIFITHNKNTMELADQLNGVTMQEPGVSRLVSVDVDEAHQMAVAQAG